METATTQEDAPEEVEATLNESADTEDTEKEVSGDTQIAVTEPEPTNTPLSIPSVRKAAVLCLSLGEDAAAGIFKHLSEEEVQTLSRELALLPDVESNIQKKVINEFDQLLTTRNYITTGGVEYAKRLLVKSFGNETARKLTDKVMHSLESSANFDTIQKTDPQQLAKMFQSEHPQTIAVVLAHLDPEAAAAVLSELPSHLRGDIVVRLAALETVSENVVKRISHVLNQKLTSVSGLNPSQIGGIGSVAEIFNSLDRDTSKEMLEQIEGKNDDLSEEIRNMMVTFEDILMIDDIGIREIMQRVDKKALALALKGTIEELQERFYSNMSSRAVEMMKEEMEFMGQVKIKDVSEAQRSVIDVLRELDEEGVITLGGGGGGDDEYVT